MVLVPDTAQAALYRDAIRPHLTAGKTLMFAHGFNVRFGTLDLPADIDVSMIAPKSPAIASASCTRKARARPRCWRCTRTRAARRKALALSYGRGIGVTRAGVIETTFAEETETDLFGEQAVLCGGVSALVKAGLRHADRGRLPARGRLFRVPPRAEADRRPDVSGRPELHALLDQRHGRARRLHRRAAARSPRRRATRCAGCSTEIQDGTYARNWIAEDKNGRPWFNETRNREQQHQIEEVGAKLRALMPFLKPVKRPEPAGVA